MLCKTLCDVFCYKVIADINLKTADSKDCQYLCNNLISINIYPFLCEENFLLLNPSHFLSRIALLCCFSANHPYWLSSKSCVFCTTNFTDLTCLQYFMTWPGTLLTWPTYLLTYLWIYPDLPLTYLWPTFKLQISKSASLTF